jgi:hypothetical protein
MSGFDFGNLGGLMQMAQQRMGDLKVHAAQLKCEGTAGGGQVKVVITGEQVVESVSIDGKAMYDKDLLEDLIRAATSDALRQLREEMAVKVKEMTGGLPIPPGFLPF